MEAPQKQDSELSKIVIPWDQTKAEQTNELSDSDLIATLKGIKMEEQELLREREHLQTTECELRNQAIAEIDAIDGRQAARGRTRSTIAVISSSVSSW